MSTALAFMADLSMILLGGKLKRMESISARFADILTHLYLASAVLKTAYHRKSSEQEAFTQWALQYCLHEIQVAFDGLFQNYPNRFFATVLRLMIFPFGRAYRKPSDKLAHSMAESLVTNESIRHELTQECYFGKGRNDATRLLVDAMEKWYKARSVDKKFRAGIKSGDISSKATFTDKLNAAVAAQVLTDVEAQVLLSYEEARVAAIHVDEFPFEGSHAVNSARVANEKDE